MGSRDDVEAHRLAIARAADMTVATAQIEGMAAAVERLDRAYAGLERRMERITASLACVERPAPIAVSAGQLRLVAG